MIKATFEALKQMAAPRQIASKRGKRVAEIFGREPGAEQGEDAAQAANA